MEVFSHYGVGIKAYAINRRPDGRIEFTLWFTIFWIPAYPWSSWSSFYAGPLRPDGIKEDGHQFDDAIEIHQDPLSYLQTVTLSILVLAVATAPIGYFIFRNTGSGATPMEMIFVFAACVWRGLSVILVERRRTKLLTGR